MRPTRDGNRGYRDQRREEEAVDAAGENRGEGAPGDEEVEFGGGAKKARAGVEAGGDAEEQTEQREQRAEEIERRFEVQRGNRGAQAARASVGEKNRGSRRGGEGEEPREAREKPLQHALRDSAWRNRLAPHRSCVVAAFCSQNRGDAISWKSSDCV